MVKKLALAFQILMSVPVVLTTVMPMLYALTLTGVLRVYVGLVMLRMETLVLVKLVVSA